MGENDATRFIIDDSRVTLQIVASLTDESRDVIYYITITGAEQKKKTD